MNKTSKKSAYALGAAGVLSALAFTIAIAAPSPAEARVVCREGWHGERCVQTRNWHHGPRYAVGGYLSRDVRYRPLPRDRWGHYERVPVGYSYIMIGNDVVLLDRGHRVVRIWR
jgi:hypothetical protein